MLVIIGSADQYLSKNIGRLVDEAGLRKIRSAKLDRIILELKQPDKLAVIDVAWEDMQQPGALRQIVNIGNITGNQVVCICPNDDEDLKKLARAARPAEVFIRYDLELGFRDFLNEALQNANKPEKEREERAARAGGDGLGGAGLLRKLIEPLKKILKLQ